MEYVTTYLMNYAKNYNISGNRDYRRNIGVCIVNSIALMGLNIIYICKNDRFSRIYIAHRYLSFFLDIYDIV